MLASAWFGIWLFVFEVSSIPDQWKTLLLGLISVAWVSVAVALGFGLKRDLTPVSLTDSGIRAKSRLVLYESIARIDPREGSVAFRLSLKNGKKALFSKIGISSEREFFEDLKVRIRQ